MIVPLSGGTSRIPSIMNYEQELCAAIEELPMDTAKTLGGGVKSLSRRRETMEDQLERTGILKGCDLFLFPQTEVDVENAIPSQCERTRHPTQQLQSGDTEERKSDKRRW